MRARCLSETEIGRGKQIEHDAKRQILENHIQCIVTFLCVVRRHEWMKKCVNRDLIKKIVGMVPIFPSTKISLIRENFYGMEERYGVHFKVQREGLIYTYAMCHVCCFPATYCQNFINTAVEFQVNGLFLCQEHFHNQLPICYCAGNGTLMTKACFESAGKRFSLWPSTIPVPPTPVRLGTADLFLQETSTLDQAHRVFL